ncbi:MAG: tetratricopeptide repeat protein [Candidatus Latescibacteria bacterium]|nr:tetratricopeptide repeat protein [Candidatus Latescibacterota bacterium]NIM65797.1 tetratricopeptide repeat protein [Candidatus Latescibacterota bacterium]NIO02289.1 tetratricopeptide repeat protein [Candidatus Latescibacterota bacterium]NIO29160.1 tetratricopeptide repeat protein [Candidatus Latescibacterota bacterium]NIO56775.1 tetratricopeptide repeat protein [Candidatus Latescibacterota bacterium]
MVFIALGIGLYLHTLSYPPVWDDHDFFELNEQIRSLKSIPQYFIAEPQKTHGGVFRPIVYVYHTILYWADGGKARGLRLFLIICHILAAIALASIVRRAIHQLKSAEDARLYTGIPELAGLYFLAHPIHIEAVTWLSGGGYAVCGLFFLIAFLLFQHGKLWLSLLSFMLSLLTTEMALSFPVVVLLYMLLLRGRDKRTGDRETSSLSGRPFFQIAAYLLVVAIYILYRYIILGQLSRGIPPYGGSVFASSLSMCKVILDYLHLLLVPGNLLVDHYFEILGKGQIWYALLIAAVLLFLIIAFIVVRRRDAVTFFFFAWFFITLLPVSNLIPTGGTPKAERYLFIPSSGISAVVILLFGNLVNFRIRLFDSVRSFSMKKYVLAFCITLIMLLGVRTFFQNRVWRSEQALWQQAVIQNLFNPRAHGNYCGTLWDSKDYVRLLSSYRRAQRYTGRFQLEMAAIWIMLGNKTKAEQQLRDAIKMDPQEKPPRKLLGQILLDKGKPEEAYEYLSKYDGEDRDAKFLMALATGAILQDDEETYQKAKEELIKNFPNYEEHARYLKAYYLDEQEMYDAAISEWEKYISEYDSTFVNMTGYAVSLSKVGRANEAELIFNLIKSKVTDFWMAYYNLAYFYIRNKQYDKAILSLSEGLELVPDQPDMLNSLAYCYLMIGEKETASSIFVQLAQQAPNYYLASGNIGRAYHHLGNFDKAEQFLDQYQFLLEDEPLSYAYHGDLYGDMGYHKMSLHYYLIAIEKAFDDEEVLDLIRSETKALDNQIVRDYLKDLTEQSKG